MVRGEKLEKTNLSEGFDLKYIVFGVSGDNVSEDFSWLLYFSLTQALSFQTSGLTFILK